MAVVVLETFSHLFLIINRKLSALFCVRRPLSVVRCPSSLHYKSSWPHWTECDCCSFHYHSHAAAPRRSSSSTYFRLHTRHTLSWHAAYFNISSHTDRWANSQWKADRTVDTRQHARRSAHPARRLLRLRLHPECCVVVCFWTYDSLIYFYFALCGLHSTQSTVWVLRLLRRLCLKFMFMSFNFNYLHCSAQSRSVPTFRPF